MFCEFVENDNNFYIPDQKIGHQAESHHISFWLTIKLNIFFFNEERSSDKWGNSFLRKSSVTHGNREEECHGSASGWLKPYQLPLSNVLI